MTPPPTAVKNAITNRPAHVVDLPSQQSRHYRRSLRSGIHALSTYLVERFQFAQSLFTTKTFAGRRDIYTTLGYLPHGQLTYLYYLARYERGGIAERIIEAYPQATWAGGARIVEDPDPNTETEFERAVRVLFTRRDVWSKLTRADILASIGRYSVLLLGAPGNLDTPLPKKLTDLLYITPIPEDRAAIQAFDDNAGSPRFGLPSFYTINLGTLTNSTSVPPTGSQIASASRQVRVHWSRIIHVAEGLLDNELYGKPRLRAPWNYLDDLDKLVGGGAEAAWKRMDPGMQLDIDPEMDLEEDEEELVAEQVEEFQHDLRRTIQTRGTKINLLASQVQGFGPNATTVIELISATTGIPQRILTGSERGELASTQDRSNWADRINERRRSFATPLVRQLLGRLIERGVLPTPSGVQINEDDSEPIITTDVDNVSDIGESLPGGYEILWPDVGEMSTTARAEVANKLSVANQAQYTAGLMPVATADEIRHIALGLGPLKLDKGKDLTPIPKAGAVSSSATRGQDPNNPNPDAGDIAKGADNKNPTTTDGAAPPESAGSTKS